MEQGRLRLTIEFSDGEDFVMLAWTIRRIIESIRDSPVPITIRFERHD